MARSVGEWTGSGNDEDTVRIDFSADLGGATITGTPTVTGVNCTGTYVSHTAGGIVTAKFADGAYAGAIAVQVVLSDTRKVERQVELRFA